MNVIMSGTRILFRIILAILSTSYVSCGWQQLLPGHTIDRVRKIDPTGIDFNSPNIEIEESRIVKLDKKNVKLFAGNDEQKTVLVIGHSGADQSITLRKGSFNISRRDGKRFILYLTEEERRSSAGAEIQPFPFYVFDLKNETVAFSYLGTLTPLADKQKPRSFWFHELILKKLS